MMINTKSYHLFTNEDETVHGFYRYYYEPSSSYVSSVEGFREEQRSYPNIQAVYDMIATMLEHGETDITVFLNNETIYNR